METQNTDATVTRRDGRQRAGGDPLRSRQQSGRRLNTDIDRELLARMRDPTHQRMIRQPGTADEEAPDSPALAEKVENFTQRASARRGTRPSRTSVAWVVATLALLGFFTAMLIAGTAISV